MLVCVLVSLTLCVVKCWHVLLFLLHYVSCVGLCSRVAYTVCQEQTCVLVFLQCVSSDGLCSCVSYTVRQVLACVLVPVTVCQVLICHLEFLRLCTMCWPVFSCL